MASKTEIGNLALSWLAQNLMASLDDNTKQAKAVKANFQFSLDSVLEEGEWSFATKRSIMSTPSAEGPAWGFTYYHPIPTTELLVIFASNRADDSDYEFDYRVEEGGIACDSDKIYVKTITSIKDTSKFTNTFNQALAARIGYDLAIPLTESQKKEATMYGIYQNKLAIALERDGSQGKHPRIGTTRLVSSR